MFSREQASGLREEFWTTFGKYMSPVYSSEGMKISWINYHTGVKDVYFRMKAEKKTAVISISIEHRDAGIQELYFEQFLELKQLLHAALEEEWTWELHSQPDGKTISRIYKEISNVSVFNKDDWHELISFFKPRIIALDGFWEDAKYSFESLK
ncbi:MAG: DUF4268 domain-containing protein [Azospira oryzae]|jgi:hypothetical protein|nr:MAG: DUF4268 domain-containing protein [Azospira oryzae]